MVLGHPRHLPSQAVFLMMSAPSHCMNLCQLPPTDARTRTRLCNSCIAFKAHMIACLKHTHSLTRTLTRTRTHARTLSHTHIHPFDRSPQPLTTVSTQTFDLGALWELQWHACPLVPHEGETPVGG